MSTTIALLNSQSISLKVSFTFTFIFT